MNISIRLCKCGATDCYGHIYMQNYWFIRSDYVNARKRLITLIRFLKSKMTEYFDKIVNNLCRVTDYWHQLTDNFVVIMWLKARVTDSLKRFCKCRKTEYWLDCVNAEWLIIVVRLCKCRMTDYLYQKCKFNKKTDYLGPAYVNAKDRLLFLLYKWYIVSDCVNAKYIWFLRIGLGECQLRNDKIIRYDVFISYCSYPNICTVLNQ